MRAIAPCVLAVSSLLLACGGDDANTSATTGASGGAGGSVGPGGAGGTGGTGAGGNGGDGAGGSEPLPPPRVLLFSKTEGFRHGSIEAAAAALTDLGADRDWEVSHTEDASVFSPASLGDFDVVVFLLTTGDVLDDTQQAALEGFIQQGGGWAGVHSASDTEYQWPWYGELVGAYFDGHPAVQEATVRVERPSHLAALPLDTLAELEGTTWVRTDEWYSFTLNPRDDVQVLMSIDELTYDVGGLAMGDHPLSWYRGFDGGRSFYTAMGHTEESYADPVFVAHVAGGIEWAGGHRAEPVTVADLDGTHGGDWAIQGGGDFPFDVSPTQLSMTDDGGNNQHLVREEVTMDSGRPYVVEALFTITGPLSGNLNSFCLNLNVAGDDLAAPSTWAINVDLAPTGGGVMKHMGFVDGAFQQIGETAFSWGAADHEYLLRVAVGAALDGTPSPGQVAAAVLDKGLTVQTLQADYTSFPYQPSGMVRIGANTHGTDWVMRGLRAYYVD